MGQAPAPRASGAALVAPPALGLPEPRPASAYKAEQALKELSFIFDQREQLWVFVGIGLSRMAKPEEN